MGQALLINSGGRKGGKGLTYGLVNGIKKDGSEIVFGEPVSGATMGAILKSANFNWNSTTKTMVVPLKAEGNVLLFWGNAAGTCEILTLSSTSGTVINLYRCEVGAGGTADYPISARRTQLFLLTGIKNPTLTFTFSANVPSAATCRLLAVTLDPQ